MDEDILLEMKSRITLLGKNILKVRIIVYLFTHSFVKIASEKGEKGRLSRRKW